MAKYTSSANDNNKKQPPTATETETLAETETLEQTPVGTDTKEVNNKKKRSAATAATSQTNNKKRNTAAQIAEQTAVPTNNMKKKKKVVKQKKSIQGSAPVSSRLHQRPPNSTTNVDMVNPYICILHNQKNKFTPSSMKSALTLKKKTPTKESLHHKSGDKRKATESPSTMKTPKKKVQSDIWKKVFFCWEEKC